MARAETAAAGALRIEVVHCPHPGSTDLVALTLPAGATLADALAASGLPYRHALNAATLRAGIWGRECEPDTPLRDRDRIEIYRPLVVDPKEARRLRYRRQRDRTPSG